MLATAFYPAAIVAGWAFVSLTCIASPQIDKSTVVQAVDRLAPSLTASIDSAVKLPAPLPPKEVTRFIAPDTPEVAAAAELAGNPLSLADVTASVSVETSPDPKPAADEASVVAAPPAAADAPQRTYVVASLGDPAEILLPAATTPAQAAVTGTAEPQPGAAPMQDTRTARARIEVVGECLVIEPCIDQFLYALYQRTPKEDTIKETEKRKVEIKRRGKTVIVTRSFTKLVENDFTWKDPKAAERMGMSMSDYVFGGMNKGFKLKLFHLLQAAENAGLQPGITSGFRDDYRQGIASGLKAASNRSYHGGSLRGGYGHGLAADITSVNGATRDERWHASEKLWKWVDANGRQYGIGRPYLRFDPPHVGPVDGPEYLAKRGGTRTAGADAKKKPHRQVAQAKPQVTARAAGGRPPSRVAAAR